MALPISSVPPMTLIGSVFLGVGTVWKQQESILQMPLRNSLKFSWRVTLNADCCAWLGRHDPTSLLTFSFFSPPHPPHLTAKQFFFLWSAHCPAVSLIQCYLGCSLRLNLGVVDTGVGCILFACWLLPLGGCTLLACSGVCGFTAFWEAALCLLASVGGSALQLLKPGGASLFPGCTFFGKAHSCFCHFEQLGSRVQQKSHLLGLGCLISWTLAFGPPCW